MNDDLYNDLLEASWQRKLTAEEDAQLRGWLAAHLPVPTQPGLVQLVVEGFHR